MELQRIQQVLHDALHFCIYRFVSDVSNGFSTAESGAITRLKIGAVRIQLCRRMYLLSLRLRCAMPLVFLSFLLLLR